MFRKLWRMVKSGVGVEISDDEAKIQALLKSGRIKCGKRSNAVSIVAKEMGCAFDDLLEWWYEENSGRGTRLNNLVYEHCMLPSEDEGKIARAKESIRDYGGHGV